MKAKLLFDKALLLNKLLSGINSTVYLPEGAYPKTINKGWALTYKIINFIYLKKEHINFLNVFF